MEINNLPETFGVYIFRDASGKPLYVGKALNIKKRVKDHLSLKGGSAKEAVLLSRSVSVEAIQVDSEIEALILEANLIKKFKPLFNSQLKDDKDFLYIKITRDSFPKVVAARKRNLKDARAYFGPFPSASKVRTTLKSLRKIFPYSTCRAPSDERVGKQKKPCFYYHLGLCPGVCVGEISQKDYRKNIAAITLFLQGKKSKTLAILEKELKKFVLSLEFEKAAKTQKKIDALTYITQSNLNLEIIDGDIESRREKELEELASSLGLDKKPQRIECFDISDIGGKQATGSMVVFSGGRADRDEYRRFRIKKVQGINDVAMIAEVLERRFANQWALPDLIIIDGGRGQLNAALGVIKKQEFKIPALALAKRLEEIYLPGSKSPLRLTAQSAALKLVQRIRDEAHRFAIAYHRKLRDKAAFD